MPRQVKVYSDGGHYIGIPPENFSSGKRKGGKKRPIPTSTPNEAFEKAYSESKSLPRKERKKYIAEQLKGTLPDEQAENEFIEQNMERKKNNASKRRVRLWRKVHLQEWNYFVTFTYADEKHTEESFKAKLRNTLKHLVSRKGWKYIGVWERGGDTQRLHFHGIFYISENAMIGALEQVTDYDTKKHRKQTTFQNTHFLKHFGRNDFKAICKRQVSASVKYLLKYIEKSGERFVFGGKLPTYFVSDILDKDIVCPIGIDDRKILLFENFMCIDEGVLMGKVSPEVIEKMPKAN